MKRLYKPLLILAIAAAVVIVAYNVYTLFNPSTQTQIVTKGSIEEMIRTNGVVIRNEQILFRESDVIVSSIVVDGERVAKGQKVADLYYGTVSQEVQSELRAVNDKIAGIENSVGQAAAESSGTPDSLMQTYARKILKAAHNKDGDALYTVHNTVLDAVNRKIAASSENAASVLAELKQKQAELEAQISGNKTEVCAPVAGIYFSAFDGYEGKITLQDMEKLTPSFLTELQSMEAESNAYDATMKIADGYTWYIAVTVGEDKLPSIRKGKSVSLRFPQYGNDVYTAEVVQISDLQNGEAVIVCKGDAYNDAVYYNRFLDVEVVLNAYSGLKFFKDAIQVNGKQTGVYVLQNDGTAKFKEVTVLSSDEGYVVVQEQSAVEAAEPLRLYDEVIITNNRLYDGVIVY